jgi:hypothetical protein
LATRNELAFPYAYHTPTSFAQFARYELITRDVPLKFGQPEFNPAFRRIAKFAVRMPMPETAVHKQRNALAVKNKIWLADNPRVAPPAGDTVRVKQRDHPQLGVSISAATDRRHYCTPFFARENVRH